MVLGIVSVKFVTTALSRELVGNYHTVYSYLQIFGILADFGLYAVAVRELAHAKNRMLTFQTLFLLRACITVLSLALALALAFLLPAFRGTPLPLGILLGSLVPFFVLLSGVFRTLFQVEYRMHLIFIAEVLSKAVPVILMGLFLLSPIRASSDVSHYFLFLFFGSAGSLLLFLMSLWFARGLLTVYPGLPKVYHPEIWAEFRRILRLAAPYGFVFLATTIYRQADVSLIALLRSDYDLQNASYGIALRIAEVAFLVPTLVMNSALPYLANLDPKSEERVLFLGHIFLALLTLGSIASLFAFFWARPLALLLAQPSYLSTAMQPGADTALRIFSIPMFLSMLITFSFYLLLLEHRWRALLTLTSLTAILSLLLNAILIPRYGFVGAGMTSVIAHLGLAISLSALTIYKVEVYLRFARFAQWFAFSLTIGALLYFSLKFVPESTFGIMGALGLATIFLIPLLYVFSLIPQSILPFKASSGDID